MTTYDVRRTARGCALTVHVPVPGEGSVKLRYPVVENLSTHTVVMVTFKGLLHLAYKMGIDEFRKMDLGGNIRNTSIFKRRSITALISRSSSRTFITKARFIAEKRDFCGGRSANRCRLIESDSQEDARVPPGLYVMDARFFQCGVPPPRQVVCKSLQVLQHFHS